MIDTYYHVWFVTKYRRPSLMGKTDKLIKKVISECIQRHKYEVLEFETNIDHIHILLQARNREALAAIIRTLKAVSAKEALSMLRLDKPGSTLKTFWARRYGSKEVSIAAIETVRKYIRTQKKHTTGGNL